MWSLKCDLLNVDGLSSNWLRNINLIEQQITATSISIIGKMIKQGWEMNFKIRDIIITAHTFFVFSFSNMKLSWKHILLHKMKNNKLPKLESDPVV